MTNSLKSAALTSMLGKSIEKLSQSAEIAFKQYTEKDKSLCKDLQENRAEQDKLQQRLNELKEHEQRLEDERKKKTEIQRTAEMVRKKFAWLLTLLINTTCDIF